MASGNITLPDDLLPRLEEIARAENRTADDLAAEAVKTLLARRALEKLQRKGMKFRGDMTDQQVEIHVDKVIHEYRNEQRGR
jgi:predicted transcriptional regulator